MFGLRWSVTPPHDLHNAREIGLTYELVAMLAFAGEYLSNVSGGALLLAELQLAGFQGARSEATITSSTTGDLEAAIAPSSAPDGLTQSARTTTAEIRDTPELVARALIERWLPAFYDDDRDLFTLVIPRASVMPA
jgi:hypothetical protein